MEKGTRLPSPPAEDVRATKPGGLIHIDLWGPATVTSIGGARYFLTCYDNYSRKFHLSFLKQKSDACTAICRRSRYECIRRVYRREREREIQACK
jgi:hypothetical protein